MKRLAKYKKGIIALMLGLVTAFCGMNLSVTEVKAATYGTDAFGAAYSKGYIRNRDSGDVIKTYKVDVDSGKEIRTSVSTSAVTTYDSGIFYTGTNTNKSAYIDYKKAARYVNDAGDPVWLDMRVYIWTNDANCPWTLKTTSLTLVHLFTSKVQKTTTEFHFYDTGHCGEEGHEKTFKGVFGVTDLDTYEGAMFFSGYNKFYRASGSYVKYVAKGSANSSNENNPFSQNTSKTADNPYFFGTRISTSDSPIDDANKQHVWIEVNSTSSVPFKYQYATRNCSRGSSLYYTGTPINYYVDYKSGDKPTDIFYCVPYGTYNLMNASKIDYDNPGYGIDGWYTKSDCKTKAANSGTAGTDAINVYGKYVPYTATITYNANGGAQTSSPYYNSDHTKYYGLSGSTVISSASSSGPYASVASSIKYSADKLNLYNVGSFGLYKTGYHIDSSSAWRINSTSGTTITQDETTTASELNKIKNLIKAGNGNVTMYANWIINQSTLTVNPNGGTWNSSTTAQSFTQNYNTTLTITNPTRTGYTFTGWTKSNPFTAGSLSGTTFTFGSANGGSGTLTAGWKPIPYKQIINVRYQNADGTWGDYSEVINADYNYDSTVSWSREADAVYQAASISYTVTGTNTKYVSVYRNSYLQTVKVRYQNADGSWGSYSNVINTNYLYGATVSWSREADVTYKAASISYTVTQANTKYVSVYRNTHTVTLNKGTGIASVSGAGTYYYGQKATINATVSVGYKWANWTGSETYSNISNSFTVDGDKTFTANAEPITYTIRFNGNKNWNTAQGSYTQKHTYDAPLALADNKFTRADATTYNNIYYERGYEFIGWGTSPTQKTSTYSNKQTVKNLTTTDNDVIDLYALWKKEITLTINFNGGKFNNDGTSKVLRYTMYNSEWNHTFDITQYYGTLNGSGYSSKGLNNNLTKTDANGIQYRFLGYSLNPNAIVPDSEFEVYAYSTRKTDYTICDNVTLYAVWEPVLQMTVQLSVSSNPGTIVLTDDVPVSTALGNFKILSGTKNTDLLSSGTASVNSATIGANVTNEDLVSYTVKAKGVSSIKFSTAADSRILDIYNHGKNNPWFDNLNEVKDFNYVINDFTSTTSSFTIPQYLGTTQSYQTSNPDLVSGTAVYGIKFTCTQPSYYYNKYWNSDESTSVYCILFLKATDSSGSTGGGLPPYAVEDGMYDFQTMLN